jgi:hypothetical protein
MPAKCVSSISPRFHYRRVAFCFLPLAAIQWLTLVILYTQDEKIRSITDGSQEQANSLRDPVSKKGWQNGSSSKSACLQCGRHWVQTAVAQNKQ